MNRTLRTAVSAAAVAALVMLVTPAGSQQPPSRVSVTLFEVTKGNYEKNVDEAPNGFSGADWGAIRSAVREPGTCDKTGKLLSRVQVIKANGGRSDVMVESSFVLRNGHITAQFAGTFADLTQGGLQGTVTGGTGAYMDAAGAVFVDDGVRRCGTKGALYTFDLRG